MTTAYIWIVLVTPFLPKKTARLAALFAHVSLDCYIKSNRRRIAASSLTARCFGDSTGVFGGAFR